MKILKERIEIEQAGLDGKCIEFLDVHDKDDAWCEFNNAGNHSRVYKWEEYDYRIKPKPLEFWVNVFDEFNGSYAYETEEKAINGASIEPIRRIKVREVL